MPMPGVCRLCIRETQLLKSHFIPRALYPVKRQKSLTLTRSVVTSGRGPELKEHLLCRECEARFDQNGESEVMRWLSPKVAEFPLGYRLRIALPRQQYSDIACYEADKIGVDAEKFAYFALSVAWRATVHEWLLPDGTVTTRTTLDRYEEIVRKYLLGEQEFPSDAVSVIVIVCSDNKSREVWGIPSQVEEAGCQNIRFVVRGVFFRIAFGANVPMFLRNVSCVAPGHSILYGDASHRINEAFGPLFGAVQPA
jgi:hypothetical protein